jgi:hypothetical protein
MVKRKTFHGFIIGLLIGFIVDLIFFVTYGTECVSMLFGLRQICGLPVKIYFFGIWFAIIGGIVGHNIKS